MQIKEGFVKSEVGGQCIVVPIGDTSIRRHCMIRLNETGSFLWECLQDSTTMDDLAAALCKKYEVEPDRARADVDAFVETLREADLLDE